MKLSISIYVSLSHLCRESELGSNNLIYSWRSAKLPLHHWSIASAHGVQRNR